jgi:cytochrome P450
LSTPDGPAWLLRTYADVRRGLTDPRLSPCERHAEGGDYRGYGGSTIHRGQTVLLSLAAANADPVAAGRPHLSFGHGPNRCAGKPVVYALIREAARARLTHDLGALWWTGGLRTRGPRGIRSTRA